VALHPLNPNYSLVVLIFVQGRKTGGPGEKLLKQGREPKNNSFHMSDTESNNQTQATVVRDERSHRYATHASPLAM
jgi:hypothetical protein